MSLTICVTSVASFPMKNVPSANWRPEKAATTWPAACVTRSGPEVAWEMSEKL